MKKIALFIALSGFGTLFAMEQPTQTAEGDQTQPNSPAQQRFNLAVPLLPTAPLIRTILGKRGKDPVDALRIPQESRPLKRNRTGKAQTINTTKTSASITTSELQARATLGAAAIRMEYPQREARPNPQVPTAPSDNGRRSRNPQRGGTLF